VSDSQTPPIALPLLFFTTHPVRRHTPDARAIYPFSHLRFLKAGTAGIMFTARNSKK